MIPTSLLLLILACLIPDVEALKGPKFGIYKKGMAHFHDPADRMDICSIIECSAFCKSSQECLGITFLSQESNCCVLNRNASATFVANPKANYYAKEEDECHSGPCKNGAPCRDLQIGYHCDCIGGYAGKHCETDLMSMVIRNNSDLTEVLTEANGKIANLTTELDAQKLKGATLEMNQTDLTEVLTEANGNIANLTEVLTEANGKIANLTRDLALQKQESENGIATLTTQVEALDLAMASIGTTAPQVAFQGNVGALDARTTSPIDVTYTSVDINIGNGLVANTGVFKAPHAGTYWLSFWARSSNNGPTSSCAVDIRKNGVTSIMKATAGEGNYMFGNAGLFTLNKDDTVDVRLDSGEIYGSNDYGQFSGFLLYV